MLLILMLVTGLLGGIRWWTTERPVHHPPGILVATEPVQDNLAVPRVFDYKGYQFAARARYDIAARVLRKEIYRIDGGAGLAPVDLGVGWGVMSDSAVVDRLEFSQMGRFFYWQWHGDDFPLAHSELQTHAAQMHMVPADATLESRLKSLRPGQVIHANGWLVDIRGPHGFTWNTSLRRDDTGNGACEILYVEALDVE